MPLRAIARLIQTMLYAKRFFPYYVYNILGGIEEDGSSHLVSLPPRLRLSPLSASVSLSLSIRGRVNDARPIGSGAVYSFDPVGSYEREACRAAGAAQSLVQPFLDNQVSQIQPQHARYKNARVREATLDGRGHRACFEPPEPAMLRRPLATSQGHETTLQWLLFLNTGESGLLTAPIAPQSPTRRARHPRTRC